MGRGKQLLVLTLVLGGAGLARGDGLQRVGHTTLTPLHTGPTDKGMHAAAIDSGLAAGAKFYRVRSW